MPDMTYQDVLAILSLIDSGSFATLDMELQRTRLKVIRREAGAVSAPVPTPVLVAAKPLTVVAAPVPIAASPPELPDGVAVTSVLIREPEYKSAVRHAV